MQKKIAVIAGDGIGPEITKEAVGVLEAVARRYGHDFSFQWQFDSGYHFPSDSPIN